MQFTFIPVCLLSFLVLLMPPNQLTKVFTVYGEQRELKAFTLTENEGTNDQRYQDEGETTGSHTVAKPGARKLESFSGSLYSMLFQRSSVGESSPLPYYYSPREEDPLGWIRPPDAEVLSCDIPALGDLRELLGEVNSHVWDPNTHSWREVDTEKPQGQENSNASTDPKRMKQVLNKKMELVIKAVDAAHSRIQEKMAVSEENLADCINASHLVWNFEPVRQKLRAAILSGPSSEWRTFTAVFGGTSITAGHDNFYNMSYPFVFERFSRCAFAAAGLRLVVQNAALGQNYGKEYSLCVSNYYDSKADIAFWEMEDMFIGLMETRDHETAMRNFFQRSLFPRRPAFVSMPGLLMTKDWTKEDSVTPGCSTCHPSEYAFEIFCPNSNCSYIPCPTCEYHPLVNWWNIPGRQLKVDDLLDVYSKFGTGRIVWDRCIAPRRNTWHFSSTKLMRVAKLKHYYTKHHPGPYGHEMMGMIIAHQLLSELKTVATEILQNHTSFPETGSSSEAMQEVLLRDGSPRLPDPVLCPEDLCRHPARCFSTYEPRVPQAVPPFTENPFLLTTSATHHASAQPSPTTSGNSSNSSSSSSSMTMPYHFARTIETGCGEGCLNSTESGIYLDMQEHTAKSLPADDEVSKYLAERRLPCPKVSERITEIESNLNNHSAQIEFRSLQSNNQSSHHLQKTASSLKSLYQDSCCDKLNKAFLKDGGEISRRLEHLMVQARDGEGESAEDLLGVGALLDPESSPVIDMRILCSATSSHCSADQLNNPSLAFEDVAKSGAWALQIWASTKIAVQKGIEAQTGYPDRKYYLEGTRDSQWLKLRFFAQSDSRVLLVCGGDLTGRPDYKTDYCTELALARLDTDVEYTIDGCELEGRHTSASFRTDHRCRTHAAMGVSNNVLNQCVNITTAHSLKGHHTLGIRARPGKLVRINQLVWF